MTTGSSLSDAGISLPPEVERLGELLAEGLTDKVIAGREGVSARTVRERFRALRDGLGAKTRFEAGFLFAGYARKADLGRTSFSGKKAGNPAEHAEPMQAQRPSPARAGGPNEE